MIARSFHPSPSSRLLSRSLSTHRTKKKTLPLTFKLHEPPNPPSEREAPRPILFMHGFFGSKQNNRTISKLIAKDLGRPVYALDLRNHGDSPHHPRHDYTAMAEDVEAFMDKHNIAKAALIGHSMGAKTAMTLALRSPQLVEALIPVDNAPIDAALQTDFHSYIKGLKRIEEANLKKQTEADEILKEYEEAVGIRQFLLTNLVRDSEGYLKFRIPLRILGLSLDNMGAFPFKDPDEARYEGPTLIVRGTRSHYVADDVLPVIGRFFPRFQVVDINAGHWVISENPEEFRKAVVNFFNTSVEDV